MISKDDMEAFAVAEKFCERAARGLPPDRWATTNDLRKIARAYETLYAIAWGIASAAGKQEYLRGINSMRMDGEQ